MSTGTGAMSGREIRDTMGLGEGVVVLVVIVGVLESFELGSGEFVGLTTSRFFVGLLTETRDFGKYRAHLFVIGFPGL